MKQIYWEKWIDPTKQEDDEDENDDDSDKKVNYLFSKIVGFVPHKNNCVYNFHICHTNFDICKREWNSLQTVSGIETLDIITRYRFRVGIGTMFDEKMVKKDINKTLLLHPLLASFQNTFQISDDLKKILKTKLNTDNFVLVLPNQNYEIFSQTDENISNCLNIQKSVNGGIYTQWTI